MSFMKIVAEVVDLRLESPKLDLYNPMVLFFGLPHATLFWPNLMSIFLGLIFGGEKVRIWTSILQGNCTFI